jgi:CheY-like chemotaxis protein
VKCKLLVAEDELIERKVLCRTLQKYLGDLISLYEAKNGREALEIFAREAPQVAVLDIEMPGLTGLEVARKIRETDKNCAILFLTGFDKFDYARQAISAGAGLSAQALQRAGVGIRGGGCHPAGVGAAARPPGTAPCACRAPPPGRG